MNGGQSALRRILARCGAELSGLVFGSLILGAARWWNSLPLERPAFLIQLGCIIALSATASICAALLLAREKLHPSSAAGLGGRMGAKTGFTTALTAGAVLSSAAFLRSCLSENAEQEAGIRSGMWAGWLVSVAAILPSACAGFVAGSVASVIRQRVTTAGDATSVAPTEPEQYSDFSSRFETSHPARRGSDISRNALSPPASPKWLSRGITAVCFLLLLLPLTAFLPPSKPVQAKILPIPEPTWRYEKPLDLEKASPLRFTIVAIRDMPEIIPTAPLSISPDGNWAAYCTPGLAGVVFVDLKTALPSSSFALGGVPTALSWSPDSKRLLALINPPEEVGRLFVIDLDAEAEAVLALPRPKNRDLPHGPVFWNSPMEAIFYPGDEPDLCYDLEELRLSSLASSPSLKPLEDWKLDSTLKWPENEAYRMRHAGSMKFPPVRIDGYLLLAFGGGALGVARADGDGGKGGGDGDRSGSTCGKGAQDRGMGKTAGGYAGGKPVVLTAAQATVLNIINRLPEKTISCEGDNASLNLVR